jgi:hypothetical protein
MAIDEQSRHKMYRRLEEVLGADEARTLMEYPVGWADVATKRDLEHLETVLRTEMGAVEARLDARLQDALRAQTFRFMTFVTGLVTGTAAAALAVARLT